MIRKKHGKEPNVLIRVCIQIRMTLKFTSSFLLFRYQTQWLVGVHWPTRHLFLVTDKQEGNESKFREITDCKSVVDHLVKVRFSSCLVKPVTVERNGRILGTDSLNWFAFRNRFRNTIIETHCTLLNLA